MLIGFLNFMTGCLISLFNNVYPTLVYFFRWALRGVSSVGKGVTILSLRLNFIPTVKESNNPESLQDLQSLCWIKTCPMCQKTNVWLLKTKKGWQIFICALIGSELIVCKWINLRTMFKYLSFHGSKYKPEPLIWYIKGTLSRCLKFYKDNREYLTILRRLWL